MRSAASVAIGTVSASRRLIPASWAEWSLFAGIAAAVGLAGRAHGAYEVSAWGPLGLALLGFAGILLARGFVARRLVAAAAAALVVLGIWSALSTSWGGLPSEAWRAFNQSLLAAAALVVGSLLASSSSRVRLVLTAVLVASTAQALEVLVRLAAAAAPPDWLYVRFLEGPAGYHNAQAALFAFGLPLALWASEHERAGVRLASGGAAAILLGALLLTQSRAVLVAIGLAVAIQLAWARSLRLLLLTAALVAAAVALAMALRSVDAAILDGAVAEQLSAFRRYVLWTGLSALVVGALALPKPRAQRARRAVVAALAAGLVVAAVAALVVERPNLARATAALTSDAPADGAPPGATRLASPSANGRLDAWRVAREMLARAPLTGAGQGQFARHWTRERRLTDLYVLQPHSLELELAAELGAVGLAAFAAFGVLAIAALVSSPHRRAAAAALGALTALLAQASVDWIWSFPAIVVPVLLVTGAAAGAGPPRRARLVTRALLAAVAVAALASVAVPYLAEKERAQAATLRTTDAGRAWQHAQAARKLNPWDPSIVALQGQLAEAAGAFRLAAETYRAAADLSQRPWLQHYREARALERAGAAFASRAACRRAIAENPAEELLRTGPCEE